MRVMQTKYRIDAFQETYFVIDSFDQLFEAMRRNFTPLYGTLKQRRDTEPGEVLPGDRLIVTLPDRRVGPPAERLREGERSEARRGGREGVRRGRSRREAWT